MIRRKSIFFFMFIIVLASMFSGCGKKDTDVITITTIPFYMNREVYVGEAPLCYLNDEMCIPVAAIDIPEDDEHIFTIDKFGAAYIKLEDLKTLENYDIIQGHTAGREAIYVRKTRYSFDYSWTENRLIAHALGGIGGQNYTNSYEAFEENYELGHRIFEVDLNLTSDGKLVCTHGFDDDVVISYDEFMAGTDSGYTRIDIDTIVELMYEYPDIYMVTDTKADVTSEETEQFVQIVNAANNSGHPEVLDRFIPQIYNDDMLDTIMAIYPWKSVIYTSYLLYEDVYSERALLDFAYKNGICVLTMYSSRGTETFLSELAELDIMAFVHTYNTEEEWEYLQDIGFYGLYTDFLIP